MGSCEEVSRAVMSAPLPVPTGCRGSAALGSGQCLVWADPSPSHGHMAHGAGHCTSMWDKMWMS